MSTDVFHTQVLFNDGEEVTLQDLNASQNFLSARLADQILGCFAPNFASNDPEIIGQAGVDIPSGPYAYTLNPGSAHLFQGSANNKIKIAAGTLWQKIGNLDGTNQKLIGFTFDGTAEVTIANGDVANPRVDIVQMKLEMITSSENRLFAQTAQKAFLALNSITTNDNTVVQAKVAGRSGNMISIQFAKRTVGVGVTLTENGNTVLIQYQDGVSTVANVEAAIVATSTLLEIKTAGTAGNVLHDPADTAPATVLAAGSDEIFITQSMATRQQVQCTLNVKQGVAAASPAYPSPDVGFVVVAGVVVGTNYIAAAGFKFDDTAGAVAVLHDQRMPFGVKPRTTWPKQMMHDTSWVEVGAGTLLQSNAGATNVRIPCLSNSYVGRLIATQVSLYDKAGDNFTSYLGMMKYSDAGGGTGTSIGDIACNGGFANGSSSSTFSRRRALLSDWQNLHNPAVGPTVLRNANGMGAPLWTNGRRSPTEVIRTYAAPVVNEILYLLATVPGAGGGAQLGPVTFWIAEGL